MPSRLSDGLTLVFVDVRGGGRSTGEAAGLTFDVLARDLEAVRADLGVDRVAVLGHSIVIEYGRRCPDAVSHVIAVGTPPSGDMQRLSVKAAPFFEQDASAERKQVLQDNFGRLSSDASFHERFLAQTPMRFFDPHLDAEPLYAGSEYRPALVEHVTRALVASWDVTVDTASLRVPTFLALGRFDYVVPYVLWDEIVLPNLTQQMFEKSGHQPFVEEPERFAEAVSDWMGVH
jgi:proline iminopeptidase